jgi:hypothetical protein
MRILVCGGREFADRERLKTVLDSLGPVSCVIHGSARGADALAHEWAFDRGVLVTPFPADWRRHGRGAGPIRNGLMLSEGKPDLVVAFPGGKGTADMVRRAQRAGLPVMEVPS